MLGARIWTGVIRRTLLPVGAASQDRVYVTRHCFLFITHSSRTDHS